MRKQFHLPEADEAYLECLVRPWETVIEAGARWLLLHEWPVPAGYNYPAVTAAVRIEPGYPDTQLDMVYFYPHLARADGAGINNLTGQVIDGRNFQRWSRHRTGENPWRSGIDDLSGHLMLVEHWLLRELRKGAA